MLPVFVPRCGCCKNIMIRVWSVSGVSVAVAFRVFTWAIRSKSGRSRSSRLNLMMRNLDGLVHSSSWQICRRC